MAANLLLLTLNSFKALFCTPLVLLIPLTGNKVVGFGFFLTIIIFLQSGKYLGLIIIKNYKKWGQNALL